MSPEDTLAHNKKYGPNSITTLSQDGSPYTGTFSGTLGGQDASVLETETLEDGSTVHFNSNKGSVDPVDPVDPKPTTQEQINALAGPNSGTGYDTLANERENQETPEFSNYTKTKTDPTVAAGETFSNAESTVAGQLENILSKGSGLQSLAQSRAREQASALGMMSSSAGIGASQRALYDSAMPIAQQDAKQMGALKLAEQATKNRQIEINTEANVAGDLLIQKAEQISQQKKIDDSFAIKLAGLDAAAKESSLKFKAGLDSIINNQQNNLARDLGQMEIDANVETTIMNQSRDMINQLQISQQNLLGNDSFLNNFKTQAQKDQAFNDLLAPVGASITMSGRMAGVYDGDFQSWVDELISDASWG